MIITAIAAVGSNGVIGSGHGMLWHLPEDWRRFKAVTMGGQLIMGRRTYESMGVPLPGRRSIVITRQKVRSGEVRGGPSDTSVTFVASLADAVAAAATLPERRTWVIGGGEIYRLAWAVTDTLDITHVHQAPEGPVTFPEIRADEWLRTSLTPRDGFDFATYERAPLEPVETSRLLLEPLVEAHEDDYIGLHTDPRVYAHAPEAMPTTDQARAWAVLHRAPWRRQGLGYWMAYTKQAHDFVGIGGVERVERGPDTVWNLYYRVRPEQQRQGYAREIAVAAARVLAEFDPDGIVEARMRPTNPGSEVLARGLGLKHVGTGMDEFSQPQLHYRGRAVDIVAGVGSS